MSDDSRLGSNSHSAEVRSYSRTTRGCHLDETNEIVNEKGQLTRLEKEVDSETERTAVKIATSGSKAAPAVTAVTPTASCEREGKTRELVKSREWESEGGVKGRTNGDDSYRCSALHHAISVLAIVDQGFYREPDLSWLSNAKIQSKGSSQRGGKRGGGGVDWVSSTLFVNSLSTLSCLPQGCCSISQPQDQISIYTRAQKVERRWLSPRSEELLGNKGKKREGGESGELDRVFLPSELQKDTVRAYQ